MSGISSLHTIMFDFSNITGFDWDDGDARKNDKHCVSMAEAEQLFFNEPLLVIDDTQHSPVSRNKTTQA